MERKEYLEKLEKAAGIVSAGRRFLLVAHMSPDADAFGASCGLMLALRQAGKEAVCINQGPIHPRYLRMPGVSQVKGEAPEGSWDALIVLDCGAWQRIGDALAPKLAGISPVINLDHHQTSDRFGDPGIVMSQACSTSEVVWDLLSQLAIRPSQDAATCLLWGIMGDTGSFRFNSTKARTFEIARELVLCGAKPSEVANGLYAGKPICQVKLEGEALSGVRLHAGGKLAEIVVTDEMYSRLGAGSEHTEELVDSQREIAGVLIAVLIYRQGDLWKVSLRANGEDLDVSIVASKFGGGGHKAAAAFRWRKELEDLRAALLPELQKLLEQV